MRSSFWLPAALAAVLLGTTPVAAQDNNDEARRVTAAFHAEYLKAYNAHDVDGLSAFFAQNAIVTYPGGPVARGRGAVQQRFRDFFAANENVRMNVVVESARFNSPQVLQVNIVAELTGGPPNTPARTFHTVVFQRQGDNEWRIVTIRPNPRSERP